MRKKYFCYLVFIIYSLLFSTASGVDYWGSYIDFREVGTGQCFANCAAVMMEAKIEHYISTELSLSYEISLKRPTNNSDPDDLFDEILDDKLESDDADHEYWTIVSYSSNGTSVSAIKSRINTSNSNCSPRGAAPFLDMASGKDDFCWLSGT